CLSPCAPDRTARLPYLGEAPLLPSKSLRGMMRRSSLPYRPFVEVLEDRSLPSFIAGIAYSADSGPQSVAAGDFNGDGFRDLAVANQPFNGSGTVSVLLGSGDGTFRAAVDYTAGFLPSWVAVSDFNGDSSLDLAVANYGD